MPISSRDFARRVAALEEALAPAREDRRIRVEVRTEDGEVLHTPRYPDAERRIEVVVNFAGEGEHVPREDPRDHERGEASPARVTREKPANLSQDELRFRMLLNSCPVRK